MLELQSQFADFALTLCTQALMPTWLKWSQGLSHWTGTILKGVCQDTCIKWKHWKERCQCHSSGACVRVVDARSGNCECYRLQVTVLVYIFGITLYDGTRHQSHGEEYQHMHCPATIGSTRTIQEKVGLFKNLL